MVEGTLRAGQSAPVHCPVRFAPMLPATPFRGIKQFLGRLVQRTGQPSVRRCYLDQSIPFFPTTASYRIPIYLEDQRGRQEIPLVLCYQLLRYLSTIFQIVLVGIPRSGQNPKILRPDDTEVIRYLITIDVPFSGHLLTQKGEDRRFEIGECLVR